MSEKISTKIPTFGSLVRDTRMSREMSLRKLADLVELSASYLSRVENDAIQGKCGPTEAVCRRLAAVLCIDPDELIALSGRVPKDVSDIIRRDPVIWSEKIRSKK